MVSGQQISALTTTKEHLETSNQNGDPGHVVVIISYIISYIYNAFVNNPKKRRLAMLLCMCTIYGGIPAIDKKAPVAFNKVYDGHFNFSCQKGNQYIGQSPDPRI